MTRQGLVAELVRRIPELAQDSAINSEMVLARLLEEYESQHAAPNTGGWIQTFTGRAVTIMDPQPDQICIEDIAHALAYTNRFGGHGREFYSIAQHSLFVCDLVPAPLAYEGLMHDAPEAYLGDCVHPFKCNLRDYLAAEAVMQKCISVVFGIPTVGNPLVKRADLIALATERRDLHVPPPRPWNIDKMHIIPDHQPLCPLPPKLAEEAFLQRYRELNKQAEP